MGMQIKITISEYASVPKCPYEKKSLCLRSLGKSSIRAYNMSIITISLTLKIVYIRK